MRSKTRVFLWILAAAFLIGLMIAALSVKKLDCEDLLLVTPISSNTSEINAERLEEINGDHALLAYEILSQENIRALNSNYDITLRKTNYSYRYILDYRMLSGSFFTEEDQKEERKAAVLNEAAAIAMFGNLDVSGRKLIVGREEYTITGVMLDRDDLAGKKGDEDARYNVYIPASVSGQNPVSFAVQMSGGMTTESVKREYKDLTIPENGYAYIHFGTLADLSCGMLFIALKSALIGIFLMLLRKGSDGLRKGIDQIKKLQKHLYFMEIFRRYPGLLFRTAAAAAAVALTAALILNIAFSFIGYFLLWNDTAPLLQYGAPSVFGEIASALARNIYFSVFLLAGFLLDIVLLLLFRRNNYFSRKITLQR